MASGNVLTVGPGQQYSTIAAAAAAAQSGDTIDVQAGTYTNDFVGVYSNVTLQAVGGVVTMVANTSPSNGKAIIDEGGPGVSVTINGFDISGAAVPYDDNGAAIRYEGGNLTLNNDYFHNNQDGLLAASDQGRIDHHQQFGVRVQRYRRMAIHTTSTSMTSPISPSRTATSTTPTRATRSRAVPRTPRSPDSRIFDNNSHRQLQHRSAEWRQRNDPERCDPAGSEQRQPRASSPTARRAVSIPVPRLRSPTTPSSTTRLRRSAYGTKRPMRSRCKTTASTG